MVPICARFKAKKVPLGGEAKFGTSHVSQPIFARKRCFGSRTIYLSEGFAKKSRCGEMVTKTAILGGFRRVGEILVAAEELFWVGQAEFACRSRLEEA